MPRPDPPAADAGPADDPLVAARRWLKQNRVTARAGGQCASTPTPVPMSSSLIATSAVDPDQEDLARRVVLRKLAAQARTRSELARALQAKQVPEHVATTVLDRMSEVGLVDDATFAQDWVSSRQRRRHLSRTALRRELQAKGVATEEVEQALAPVGDQQEYEAALSLAVRRHDPMAHLTREVRYRRLAGVLGRRGFASSLVARVVQEVVDRPEDPDHTVPGP